MVKQMVTKYILRITPHHTQWVMASSLQSAKNKVWNDIKDGYTYGYRTKAQFIKGVKRDK
jgi:hypothetical protein